MNLRKLNSTAVCLLSLALIYFVARAFTPEILALGWHVFHGRTVRLISPLGPKFDVDVPILTMADLDEGGWNLFLSYPSRNLPLGNHSSKWGIITFSVSPPTTAENIRESAPKLRDHGIIYVEVGKVSAQGQDFYCFDHSFSKPTAKRREMADIDCVPLNDKRGISARLMGSSALLPEFYSLLSRVKRVN